MDVSHLSQLAVLSFFECELSEAVSCTFLFGCESSETAVLSCLECESSFEWLILRPSYMGYHITYVTWGIIFLFLFFSLFLFSIFVFCCCCLFCFFVFFSARILAAGPSESHWSVGVILLNTVPSGYARRILSFCSHGPQSRCAWRPVEF